MRSEVVDTLPAGKSLSYACGPSEVPLLGKCIGQVLDDTAEKYPDHDGLVVCHQELRYTYGELREEVERAARGFLGLGIQKGDRVGIWSTNSAEWVLSQFATAKIGAILVNVNPSNAPASWNTSCASPTVKLCCSPKASEVMITSRPFGRSVRNWTAPDLANCNAQICRTCGT